MIARLTIAALLIGSACSDVFGQDPGTSDVTREPMFDVGEIEVPEGDVTDVVEFLQEMTDLQQNLSSDYRAAMTKITAAQSEASNRILDEPEGVSDEHFAIAARFGLANRVRATIKANAEEQSRTFELVRRQLSIAIEQGATTRDLSNANTLASYLERYGDPEVALTAYRTFAEMIIKADNPKLKSYANRFEGSARRLALLGNELVLEGELLDGSEFDWAAYRGKVVLVDFWATWCGPCIAEAPNVRKHYDLYHERGFEVVGISLDTKKEALAAYVEKENVQWVNLYHDGAGWKHPMAVKYGVSAIPTVFLVDRDGKVVSLRARGSELGLQLEKLLGPRDVATRDLAAAGKWKELSQELKQRIDAKQPVSKLGLAAAQILAGDMGGYRETCEAAMARSRDSHMWAKASLVKLCSLAPENGIDPKLIQQIATEARAKSDNNSMKIAIVLAAYRSGTYERCFEEQIGGDQSQRALTRFYYAMAAQKLGRIEEAVKWYAEGDQIFRENLRDFHGNRLAAYMDDHWISCAVAQIIRDEARKILNQGNGDAGDQAKSD